MHTEPPRPSPISGADPGRSPSKRPAAVGAVVGAAAGLTLVAAAATGYLGPDVAQIVEPLVTSARCVAISPTNSMCPSLWLTAMSALTGAWGGSELLARITGTTPLRFR